MNVITTPRLTMSSRELATLTQKKHAHVMRDIRDMLETLGLEQNPFLDFDQSGAKGRTVEFFRLPRRECEILVTGYDVTRRAAVIDRWLELEQELRQQQRPAALPSAKELALMVIAAEEAREHAEAEAKRLNGVCNTISNQFVAGLTVPRFCMQLNGVNTQQVQAYLVSRGFLIHEGSRGYRPAAHVRDNYFKLASSHYNDKERYQVQLTQKGCKWMYSQYLRGFLPMKKQWDGRLVHNVAVAVEV